MRGLEEIKAMNKEAYKRFVQIAEHRKQALHQTEPNEVAVFCPVCENLLFVDVKKAEATVGVTG